MPSCEESISLGNIAKTVAQKGTILTTLFSFEINSSNSKRVLNNIFIDVSVITNIYLLMMIIV